MLTDCIFSPFETQSQTEKIYKFFHSSFHIIFDCGIKFTVATLIPLRFENNLNKVRFF
jgi:hypothetical protein